jgi:hypothetical protein
MRERNQAPPQTSFPSVTTFGHTTVYRYESKVPPSLPFGLLAIDDLRNFDWRRSVLLVPQKEIDGCRYQKEK